MGLLVLTRRKDEEVLITVGADAGLKKPVQIRLIVVRVDGRQKTVRLGFDAAAAVTIVRGELLDRAG